MKNNSLFKKIVRHVYNLCTQRAIIMRSEEQDVQGLHDLMEYTQPNTIVEIGSYTGESSEIFAEYAQKLFCIDPWETLYDPKDFASFSDMKKVEKMFDTRMKPYTNIKKIKMKSEEAYTQFEPQSIDLVYIDANHTYDGILADIKLWKPKIRKGGYMSGHDYSPQWPGVIKAVDETFGTPDKIFKDSSWVKQIL